MGTRLVASVSRIAGAPPTRHFIGFPPELTAGADERQELPQPSVLLIEEEQDGVSLIRLGRDGSFAGDTWHPSMDEAKEQAHREYGAAVGEWRPVPDAVSDAVSFALGNED